MKSVIEAGLACLDAKEKKPEQARKVEVS